MRHESLNNTLPRGTIAFMTPLCPGLLAAVRRLRGSVFAALIGAALLALAACSGTAVVTMTSTASTDNFLAYRVGLVSVQLQSSSGKSGVTLLPASTTVDFATLTDLSEVLGAAAVSKGTYTSALITLDYSLAQIIYDDGSVYGVALTPVGANGNALGQVQITATLDPSNSFSVAPKGASLLAVNFNMAASNVVNLNARTVTVTPLIAASTVPIDAKQVRIRGPLQSVSGASFGMGVMPFNSSAAGGTANGGIATSGTASGGGLLSIVPADTTTYEINGIESTGTTGVGQLAALSAGTLAVAYGTLTAANQTTTTPTTTTAYGTQGTAASTDVTFAATQVLAGTSVQSATLDRVTGVVSARSGNTIALDDATLIGADGSETLLAGTDVLMGPNTLVTVFGQGGGFAANTVQRVSVGSSIDAFGILTSESSGIATLDASAGQVRLDISTASGLVVAQGSGSLTLNLASLGGRAVRPFNFLGSGVSPGQYGVSTPGLDLTNSTAGVPVIVTGLTGMFGAAANFTAVTLLDPTTIPAELVVDWGAGTATPFTTYDGTAIDVDAHNSSIGVRHLIQIGAQTINIVGLSSDPLIVPSSTSSNVVFTIGHAASSTTENFNTYAAFITALQSELKGSTLATGVTAVGQYTGSTFTLAATSITLFLNN